MKVVVLDDYADALRRLVGLDRLRGHAVTIHTDAAPDDDALVARLEGAEAVLAIQQRCPLPARILSRLPALRLISQTGRNTSHIDLAACAARGILVSARGMGPSPATAELTWALILAVLRDIPRQAERLRQGLWLDGIGTVLAGRRLGVWGFGEIGRQVAQIGQAFGMRVMVWGREGSLTRARLAGFEVASGREELFSEADVLTLHLALNDETRAIVTATDLSRMKPAAVFVNTARALLIAPGALAAALAAGRPGRAAVDVFEHEPVLGATDPLLHLPNVLATPHLGYSVAEMYGPLLSVAVDQIIAYDAGTPINLVAP